MTSSAGTVPSPIARSARSIGRVYRALQRRRLPKIPIAILILVFFIGVFGPSLAPKDPYIGELANSLEPPIWLGGSLEFPFGTDFFGRDVFSRLLDGARITLVTALVALVGSAVIGITVGLVSGYFGGWVDAVVMRLVDFMLAMPGLLLALVFIAAIEPSLRSVILAVMISGWVAYARYVRGDVLAQREREYITAAISIGCGAPRIMFRHLLPNVLATVMVIATLQTGGFILLVASLSFLGVGIPKPTSAWGVMIADGREFLLMASWVAVVPGVAISMLIISLNLVGDWMRDTFDPRLRTL